MNAPTASVAPADGTLPATRTFDHILVAVDGGPECLVAAAEARHLRAPAGRLELVGLAETDGTTGAGVAAALARDELLAGVETCLARAAALAEPDEVRLLGGRAPDALLAEIQRSRCTLVAVGAARLGHRLTALAFRSIDATALHNAACSVLVARPGVPGGRPRRIVVGVDGSPRAAAAEAAARTLAHALDAELVSVVALGGKPVDAEQLRASRDEAVLDPRDPVTALVADRTASDLLVVGSHGRHGLRALGSVSERVAAHAGCSVLVVRTARP